MSFLYIKCLYFKEICISEKQLNCVRHLRIESLSCLSKCEGVDIIGYTENDVDSDWNKIVLKEWGYDSNLKTTRDLAILSEQYNKFKQVYEFPMTYKGNFFFIKINFTNVFQIISMPLNFTM